MFSVRCSVVSVQETGLEDGLRGPVEEFQRRGADWGVGKNPITLQYVVISSVVPTRRCGAGRSRDISIRANHCRFFRSVTKRSRDISVRVGAVRDFSTPSLTGLGTALEMTILDCENLIRSAAVSDKGGSAAVIATTPCGWSRSGTHPRSKVKVFPHLENRLQSETRLNTEHRPPNTDCAAPDPYETLSSGR